MVNQAGQTIPAAAFGQLTEDPTAGASAFENHQLHAANPAEVALADAVQESLSGYEAERDEFRSNLRSTLEGFNVPDNSITALGLDE